VFPLPPSNAISVGRVCCLSNNCSTETTCAGATRLDPDTAAVPPEVEQGQAERLGKISHEVVLLASLGQERGKTTL